MIIYDKIEKLESCPATAFNYLDLAGYLRSHLNNLSEFFNKENRKPQCDYHSEISVQIHVDLLPQICKKREFCCFAVIRMTVILVFFLFNLFT